MLPGLLQGISRELGNGFKSFFKIGICRDGTGLGCDAFQTLFLGIAGLGNGTVELVGAGWDVLLPSDL